jgi:hypothetical protein
MVIVPPTSVRVLVATRPVDFRKGMDGLAALVQEEIRADPFSGVIYVFRAKRADRVKLLLTACVTVAGVPGGATTANQVIDWNPATPAYCSVGTSGRVGTRLVLPIARMRRLPR